jgi:hypothetical protein
MWIQTLTHMYDSFMFPHLTEICQIITFIDLNML